MTKYRIVLDNYGRYKVQDKFFFGWKTVQGYNLCDLSFSSIQDAKNWIDYDIYLKEISNKKEKNAENFSPIYYP